MTQEPEPQVPGAKAAPEPPRAASGAARIAKWSLFAVLCVALLTAGLAVWGIGQTLTLPDWVRDRIETRIERNLNGLQIEFGDVQMVVNKGWRPRVRLLDVTLSEPDGQPIVQLADAQASLAMRPLLRGLVQPKNISLSGAFARLRRDASGNLSLSLGNATAPVDQAASLPQLIEQWDQLFLLPALSALVSVDIEALTLQYEDALKNRAWTLDGGRIRFDRDADQLRLASSFALLSGTDSVSSVEMNYASRIGSTKAEFGVVVADIAAPDIAAQNVALGWLDVLRAPISGALRGSVDDEGALGPLSATLHIGAGVLQPTDATRPIPFNGARSYFTYRPDDQALVFNEVFVSSGWGSGLSEGRAYLDVEGGVLKSLVGQFSLADLQINPDRLYDEPLLIAGANADFRLEFAPFRMQLGQLYVTQEDIRLFLTGSLSAEPEGWSLAVDGETGSVTRERLLTIWPERAAPKPREWVDENLLGGMLEDVNFALRVQPGQTPNVYLDFDYDDATVRAVKTLPPITGAFGQASLAAGRFVTTATAGAIVPEQGGPVDISGTSFIIPDVEVKPATPGIARVTGKGSVTAILSLLDLPPLSVLKDTPFPVDLAQGQARVTGTVALPMKPRVPFEEIEFHLAGTVEDAQSDLLVPDYSVAARKLEVVGNQQRIEVKGPASIGPVPMDVRWRQPLGPDAARGSRVDGRIELSPLTVDTFGIGLPKGSVSGKGWADVRIDLAPGRPPDLLLRSDLSDVGLALPSLGWSKPQSGTGLLELAGVLGPQSRIDRLILEAAGMAVTGSVLTVPGGGLDRALLGSVRLGDWLDTSVEIIGRGSAAPDLRILGGTLDLRRATFGEGGGGDGAPGDLQVALNRLQVTDTLALTGFAGAFKLDGGLNGRFRGKVNGQTEVAGQVVPQSGRSAVRIQSDDAGGVVRSAGLLTKARDGSFDLSLLPTGGPGQFDGTLRIRNTRVIDAPAIAALLNSISVVGLLDELSGQGIQFGQVDARFRLEPARVTVFESSATGPSIGLSMDGVFDVASGTLRMQGVISPVYLLNQIGNLVARRGEGIIGFNYTLTGPAASPRVQVNPLSALAPGFLRDIMRTSPPPIDENAPPARRTPHRKPDDANSGR
ncbi:AsmA-like C-terminal region-containing protein [Sedimentitalea sp. JM2-8]|uniref:AsmA-like C-terminal region-containing protein n=1 Tax=Sedimentitalea xiamensis TaxID=3050037 RepID=A0ABT7FBE7_9RHOB|nr:AsmA-like C-terminal region-containing protein [Sedimentitalea xiamensis]MDK3072422.1 AsmA-like C-terminal region-containing protein [Sedimentitalea xiamensis]